MKKTILLVASVLVAVLIAGSSLAQGQTSQSVALTRVLNLSPDNFLYGLGVALDNLRLDLTFNDTAKAQLGLGIAEDRIIEAQNMMLDKKFDVAQNVLGEYNKTLDNVKSSISGISSSSPNSELTEKVAVEKEVEQHESDVENSLNEAVLKASLVGNLTQSQLSLLDSFVPSLLNSTGEVKDAVNGSIEKAKLRIEQETGKNATEVDQELNDLENRTGLTAFMQSKAKNAIADAVSSLNDLLDKLNSTNATSASTAVNTLLSESQSKLSDAQTAFNQSDFGRAFGLAKASESLSENAKRILEAAGEGAQGKTDVEARVIGNQIEVKVEHNGFENTFFVNTTDLNSAVNSVANQLGISVNEINLKIKQSLPDIESQIQDVSNKINEKISDMFGEGGLRGLLTARNLSNSSSVENIPMNER